MSRKAFVACLLLALTAMAAASQAAAQTKLSIAKVANDFALSMADYGNTLGTFQKNGLAVTVSEITQAKMIQATIGGSVDIALASGATLAFAAKGAPLTGVAALSGPPSILFSWSRRKARSRRSINCATAPSRCQISAR